ncbi:hypothetical protein GYH30_040115 [Glycine max]|uniref:DUF7271 domain-containing protein n=1 Tax=Glycine max TaxID=3847 RepID=A0A0R0GMK7_SOYBN|nr:hypothetical protein GYH30_040115 [Glycine max]
MLWCCSTSKKAPMRKARNPFTSKMHTQGPSNWMARTRFTTTFRVDKNIIEVPLTYHRQWRPYYQTYVLLDYNGSKHFVRLRKYGTRYFFADGMKEFRRAHDINDSVIIRFFAASKDTSFDVDVMGPIHRQTRRRSVVTTKRHIFTADVTQEMMEHNNPLIIVHNGLPSVAEPWFQYLSKNNLMAGDEVVFFFRFDEHVWEVIFRKQVIWDEDLSN